MKKTLATLGTLMSFPVTVIIATWKSARTLENCLRCTKKYLDRKEIIIVGRNSADWTVKIAEKYDYTILFNTISLRSARITLLKENKQI